MSDSATPRPWKRGPYGGIYAKVGGPMIGSCNGPKNVPLPNCPENEKLIVHHVNSHDALVDALTLADKIIEDAIRIRMPAKPGEETSKYAIGGVSAALGHIRKALKAAGEEVGK